MLHQLSIFMRFLSTGTPVKMRLAVFEYELINYDTIAFIYWLQDWLCNNFMS